MKKIRGLFSVIIISIFTVFAFQGCGEKGGEAVVNCKLAKEWTTVQDFQYKSQTLYSGALDVTTDSKGTIYVAGFGADDDSGTGSEKSTVIQKSTDGGSTWETIRQKILQQQICIKDF